MRLHWLRIEAFGPFPGVETIDFDALSEQGVHLIHGPTGAGKTTILDAVCFALFGQLPGSRHGQRESLRSDHAGAGAVPTVTLEATVGGRRLRIERSPEHRAPKKRGAGLTRRQAKVVLQEQVGGRWSGVSTRLDEVGDVIEQALGMGLDQFAQVVLLPQGQFAAFLQARPDERGAVLRRLFDVQRFADLEEWLAGRRRDATSAAQDARTRVTTELRVLESVLSELAPQDEETVAWSELEHAQIPEALRRERSAASAAADAAMAAASRADAAADRDRELLVRARQTFDLQQQAQRAQADLDRLDQRAADLDACRGELARARRAAQVEPSRRSAGRATQELQQVHADHESALAALAHIAPRAGAIDAEHEEALRLGSDRLREGVGLVRQARSAGAEVAQAAQALTRVTAAQAQHHELLERARRRVDALEAQLEVAQRDAATRAAAEARLEQVRQAEQRRDQVTTARVALGSTRAVAAEATASFASAERDVLRLRTVRLEHLAATLADGLDDGAPCPVCGSPEHPDPARLTLLDVSEDTLDEAEERATAAGLRLRDVTARVAVADAAVTSAEDALAESCVRLDLELGADGAPEDAPTPDRLTILLDEITAQVETARAAELRLAELVSERRTTVAQVAAVDARREEHERQHAVLQAAQDAASARLADLLLRLETLEREHRADCPCEMWRSRAHEQADDESTLEAHARAWDQSRRRHDQVSAGVLAARRAEARLTSAQDAATRATDDLATLLDEHGFADAQLASAAWRDQARVEQLQQQIDTHQTARERSLAVLEQPAVVAAREQERPDLEQVQHAATAAAQRAREAHATMATSQRAAARLDVVSRDLLAALAAWRPREAELRAVTSIADTVNGGGDNLKKMRLSSYVLAARLEEVTRLANERLTVMTDGRFELAHSDARVKGGLRSGLGLVVHDAWTGQTRDTATLSGGEAFLASLSLALGLGEAVRQESGGVELQTLFVDEGFGSLDEQSLEQVMAVLDTLRAGGRSVGIVSHVAELRHRVTARIEVAKTESGSTLRVHLAGAPAA
ncbi:AAA family ATPase [Luteipulveratus mongoliensis]|uniref:Nuclease SbcCD subunit C n=1 Tax=Luteipulveratus mongoliensis TaxID=571913 RepID=A0A0K1JJN7_9MICO|nr:SMC family ATPase [Luteipulveratus mongoliensis]AKU16932.1 hypothetical protein VV02_15500 [Luteipulveratus mongoliensis]